MAEKGLLGGLTITLTSKDLGVKLNSISPALRQAVGEIIKSKFVELRNKIRENLEKNGSVDTGALKDSIGGKVELYPKSGNVEGFIGIRTDVTKKKAPKTYRGRAHTRYPVSYAYLVERGFTHWKNGEKINGKPFFEPAVEAMLRENKMENEIRKMVEDRIKDLK